MKSPLWKTDHNGFFLNLYLVGERVKSRESRAAHINTELEGVLN